MFNGDLDASHYLYNSITEYESYAKDKDLKFWVNTAETLCVICDHKWYKHCIKQICPEKSQLQKIVHK